MRHGKNLVTGARCVPFWVTVQVMGRSARAVDCCTCGLARSERIDVESVLSMLEAEQMGVMSDG